MYSGKLFITVVIFQTLLKVNCQCTESRRAARNYGQILPAGVAPSVDDRENERSSTLKPEGSSKEEQEEEENRSTSVAFREKDFTRKKTDNDAEEDNRRREIDRWNNSEKDREDDNAFVYTSAPVIAPNSQYSSNVFLNVRETEKSIESGGSSRQNSSKKYKKKEKDAIVYSGYIVAPKVNISRKALEIEKERHQEVGRETGRQNHRERNKKESVNYNRSVLTSRNVNLTHRKEAADEENDFRGTEHGRWTSGQTANGNRYDQKQESDKEKVQKNKHGRRHKEEDDNEEEEDENE